MHKNCRNVLSVCLISCECRFWYVGITNVNADSVRVLPNYSNIAITTPIASTTVLNIIKSVCL